MKLVSIHAKLAVAGLLWCVLATSAQAQWWGPYPQPGNPVVGGYGPTFRGFTFNPLTGQFGIRDGNRAAFGQVPTIRTEGTWLPGVGSRLDRVFVGADGRLYRQTGQRWRNAVNGQRHGQIKTRPLFGGGNSHIHEESVITSDRKRRFSLMLWTAVLPSSDGRGEPTVIHLCIHHSQAIGPGH